MADMETAMVFEHIGIMGIASVAKAIIEDTPGNICLLVGDMGSGKTTLVRAICQELEIEDNVSSPTFALVNEYLSNKGRVCHFDFYRMNSIEEALDAGVEDYFYSGDLCLIEWPEIIEPILPERGLRVEIEVVDQEYRTYKLTQYESN